MLKLDNGMQVFFKHYPDEDGNSFSGMPYHGRTLCVIEDSVAGECLRDGESFCGLNEKRFDKAVGRKVALAKALEGAPREFRTEVWKKYIETVKHL
jgi:hypothetical protein